LRAGQRTPQGVKLIGADSSAAILEIDGKRRTLSLGQGIVSGASPSAKPTATLIANVRGHFITMGSIDGASVRFLVDTGSTTVAISSTLARNLGISYLHGRRGYTNTANGPARAYRIVLDNVRVGDITLNQVEGTVIEGNTLPFALLGMSFLKRLEMKREGSSLTLVKQY
jgi:aspartyl protease family protein